MNSKHITHTILETTKIKTHKIQISMRNQISKLTNDNHVYFEGMPEHENIQLSCTRTRLAPEYKHIIYQSLKH